MFFFVKAKQIDILFQTVNLIFVLQGEDFLKKKLMLLLGCSLVGLPLFAEEKATEIKLHGLFDFYYLTSSTDGNSAATPNNADDSQSYRYYDIYRNDFTVNLAELNVVAKHDKITLNLDLDFGDFAEQNAADEISKHIGQAYAVYDFDGKHKLTAGKFYTHVGFEVAKAKDNWNYSRAYTFGWGPFWHEGVAVTGAYSNGFKWGAYVYDGTDYRRERDGDKTYGAQLGYAHNNFAVTYNYISGPEGTLLGDSIRTKSGDERTIHEFNASVTPISPLTLAIDYLSGKDEKAGGGNGKDQTWVTYVGYAHYKLCDTYSLTWRTEIYHEKTAAHASFFRLGVYADKITAHTLTGNMAMSSVSDLRLEFRHDGAKRNIFENDLKLQKTRDTVALAWLIRI